LQGQVQKNGSILKVIAQLPPSLNAFRKGRSLFQDLCCFLWRIPKALLRDDRLDLAEALLLFVYVKDSP